MNTLSLEKSPCVDNLPQSSNASTIDLENGVADIRFNDPNSSTTTIAVSEPPSPSPSTEKKLTPQSLPNEPLYAWLQCLMGVFAVVGTQGLAVSFGIFQVYYENTFSLPPSTISWIGSVQLFLPFFLGAGSGYLVDAGFFRVIYLAGSCLIVGGILGLSFATQYIHVILAQGVCCGLGGGLLFSPTVSTVTAYFGRHRSLAMGVLASGAAIGGMVFPAMFQQLLPRIGFAWTMRAIALLVFSLLAVANVVIAPKSSKRIPGKIFDTKALREIPYVLYMLGVFLMSMGTYTGFFYVGSFGRDILSITSSESFSLIIIINGVGFIARLITTYLTRFTGGPLPMLLFSVFGASAAMYAWAGVHNYAGLVIWDCVYGWFAAAIQGLFPAALFAVCSDSGALGVRMGMMFSVMSFAVLIGCPIAGALVEVCGGKYIGAQMFAGSALLAGCCVLTMSRIVANRRNSA